MSGWCDRIDFPELGVGWVRLSKQRPADQVSRGSRQVDHMYVAPSGAKFRSIKQAQEYICNGHLSGGASAGASASTAKAKFVDPSKAFGDKKAAKGRGAAAAEKGAAKKAARPPRPKDPAALAKAEAAREATAAARLQVLYAQNENSDQAVCFTCGSGDEVVGNEILLCDGAGCRAAYHLRCLERPLFSVPEGDWLCPACEPLPPAPEKLMSPAAPGKRLQPERQSVDGCDMMRWARTRCADAPRQLSSASAAPAPLALSAVCGRACLYAADGAGRAPSALASSSTVAWRTRPRPAAAAAAAAAVGSAPTSSWRAAARAAG